MFWKRLLIITLFEFKLINSSPTQQEFFTIEEARQGIRPTIINGFQAIKGQFPWQVAITTTLGFTDGFCGGSLISDQWILTAAHCTSAMDFVQLLMCVIQAVFSFNFNVDCFTPKFTVIIGSLNARKPDLGSVKVEVDYAINHPKHLFTSNNDISLIKLKSKVIFNDVIKPINLSPSTDYLGSDVTVLVSGWGKTKDADTQISEFLNYVNLKTITNDQCNTYYNTITDNTVCAISPSEQIQNSCNGDSGGPLIIFDVNGNPIHVGIVSFVSRRGCESGSPSGYTRTSQYRDWIREQTGI